MSLIPMDKMDQRTLRTKPANTTANPFLPIENTRGQKRPHEPSNFFWGAEDVSSKRGIRTC